MRPPLVLAALALSLPAVAGPCDKAALATHTTEAMSIEQPLREEGYTLLKACFRQAMADKKGGSAIAEERLDFLATLSGRLALASYAADELPATTAVVAPLLQSHFDEFYFYVRSQPEGENSALMRAMISQNAETPTGSIEQAK